MKRLNPDFQSYFTNSNKLSTSGNKDASTEGSVQRREYTNSVQEKRSNQIKNQSFMKVLKTSKTYSLKSTSYLIS